MEVVIGLGSGRCGTQTFAEMFGLTHQAYDLSEGGDVSQLYLYQTLIFNDQLEKVKFVCLKRDREKTIQSFVKNGIMSKKGAELYYDEYYRFAERYEKILPNFKIFDTEELNYPKRIETFIGRKAKKVEIIKGVCPLFKKTL